MTKQQNLKLWCFLFKLIKSLKRGLLLYKCYLCLKHSRMCNIYFKGLSTISTLFTRVCTVVSNMWPVRIIDPNISQQINSPHTGQSFPTSTQWVCGSLSITPNPAPVPLRFDHCPPACGSSTLLIVLCSSAIGYWLWETPTSPRPTHSYGDLGV